MTIRHLDCLLKPGSIAIAGASDDAARPHLPRLLGPNCLGLDAAGSDADSRRYVPPLSPPDRPRT